MVRPQHALITGADGFSGFYLAECLVAQKHKGTAFVQYNSFNAWGWCDASSYAKGMEHLAGDVREPNGVRGV